jgi:hypothetical protein
MVKVRPPGASGFSGEGERVGIRVVETVDPHRGPRLGAVGGPAQVRLLASVHGDAVVLVLHEPDQESLELVELRIAVTAHAHVGGAVVESVKRVIGGGVEGPASIGDTRGR